MPISYSLIALGTTVLAESYVTPGNFTVIARRILPKIPQNSHKKSYAFEGQIFHYIADENGLICMCMADEKMPHRMCFAFLQEVKTRFLGQYDGVYQDGTELSFNDRFSRTLRERMDYYSNDPDADKIRRVRGEIDDVKVQMKTNIDKVLQRGDKIESLVDKTDALQNEGMEFKHVAVKMKRQMWWKNVKVWVGLIAILLIIAIVIAVVIVLVVEVF